MIKLLFSLFYYIERREKITFYDIVHSIYKYICGITQIGSAVIGESFKGYMCILAQKQT